MARYPWSLVVKMNSKIDRVRLKDVVGKGYATFWKCKTRYRVLMGGRASKKSKTTALYFVTKLMEHPDANLLVARRYASTLYDSCYSDLLWAMERLHVSEYWEPKRSPLGFVYKPTGQRIIFRGLDDAKKITSISVPKGALCWVWIEEAFEITDEDEFNKLDMSIRGDVPNGLWKQITLTFNPWSDSSWLKARFFDVKRSNTTTFVTTYECNEWLDESDRELFEDMKKNDPERYAVEGEGNWGILGGRFFKWSGKMHVCEPFKIPESWPRFRCMDWGSSHPYAVYWVACDYDGNLWVYRELYGYGGKRNVGTKETSRQVAQRIAALEKDDKNLMQFCVLDNACWAKIDTGSPSVAEEINKVLLQNGCRAFIPSVKDRSQAAEEMKLRLYGDIDGEGNQVPGIRFFRNCVHAIRTIPDLTQDKHNPEKVATDGEDHAYDAIAYLLLQRPYGAEHKKKPTAFELDGWNDRESRQASVWGV